MRFTKTITVLFPFFAITLCILTAPPNIMASELKKVETDFRGYSLGRVSFDMPSSMHIAGKKFVVGYAKVEEIIWKDIDQKELEREKFWKKYTVDIKSMIPPDGINETIIENIDLSDNSQWKKAVLFYSNRINKNKVQWSTLTDKQKMGLLVSIEGGSKFIDTIKKGVNDVSESYVPFSDSNIFNNSGPKFYTEYGVFQYPFDEAEELYVRFENHPLNLKLSIKTKVVKKVEKTNILERLSAALAANFAPGVSVDKIRTEQRTVAGLKGDEVIMRGTEGKKSELSFAWRFNGEKNSATAPRITIEMESPDGQLEEKLAIWDAVLDSMQVIPQ